jgi:hypothetical protein
MESILAWGISIIIWLQRFSPILDLPFKALTFPPTSWAGISWAPPCSPFIFDWNRSWRHGSRRKALDDNSAQGSLFLSYWCSWSRVTRSMVSSLARPSLVWERALPLSVGGCVSTLVVYGGSDSCVFLLGCRSCSPCAWGCAPPLVGWNMSRSPVSCVTP